MAGQGNAAPVIIKRKKVVQGGGHHGGAWKVAYADFVTAMMAFFMLMWLLNATTEKQRKGIADYFNPTIPVNRVSGGGNGAFGGDSTFTESTLAQNGTGATAQNPTEADKARGEATSDGEAAAAEKKELAAVEQALTAKGGESMTMERLLRHVVTRVTDEGLVIEIFDLDGTPLFRGETAEPMPQTVEIAALLSDVLQLATNEIAVNGHVRSYPITLRQDPTWDLSTERAQALRLLLEKKALPDARIARVTGHANRKPATADPTAQRNNRIEIVLLRKNL
jgi:chemotaxis protein MotB